MGPPTPSAWRRRPSFLFYEPCCRSLGLRLAHALIGFAAVPAHQRSGAGLEHDVLGPGRPRTGRAHEHDVRVVERRLEVDDATLRHADATAGLPRLGVALQDVDALDHDLVLVGKCAEHFALLALVLTRGDDDGVAGGEVEPATLGLDFVTKHWLENLRGKADDLHEVAFAQLSCDGTENARPTRVVGLREQHRRVLVETDERAVRPSVFLGRADHDRLHDLTLLDLAAGLRGLDGGGDDVANRGVPAIVPAGNADAQDLLGTRVVRDLESCLLLNHGYFAFSTISSRRQRFSLEMGRVSVMRTRSPIPHSFFSSWTLNLVRCWTVFL